MLKGCLTSNSANPQKLFPLLPLSDSDYFQIAHQRASVPPIKHTNELDLFLRVRNRRDGMKQTDRHWEAYGKKDPYYGVITDPKYKRENLDPKDLDEFFTTGEAFVEKLFQQIRQQVDSSFKPALGLDFGCGVGRLAIPISRRCIRVHAVDVSISMLKEAETNALKHHSQNIEFLESDDSLSRIEKQYDFINSYIVLQHIPPKRGLQIFQGLLDRLNNKGVFALQVPFHTPRTSVQDFLSKLRRYVPAANAMANLIEGKPRNYPHMEMNVYPLDTVCRMIQDAGVSSLCVNLESDPLFRLATLIGQKR
jgi:trans-aconitate methyltransferase